MPNNQDRSFAWLDAMSDEELRNILRDDASKTEGEDIDMEMILYVMEVLAKRRNERNEGKSPAEALDSFNRNYRPKSKGILIFEKTEDRPRKQNIHWFKRAIAVAAVLVLMISCSIQANAWGFDWWEIFTKWTKETFYFVFAGEANEVEAPTPEFSQPFASLQTLLDKYKVSVKLAPTWLPEGYEEVELDVQENPKQRRFFARYQHGDDEIIIRISDYLGADPNQVEQHETLLELYKFNGIQYYIMDNYGLLHVTWVNECYECVLTGSVTLDEMKQIINSIQ